VFSALDNEAQSSVTAQLEDSENALVSSAEYWSIVVAKRHEHDVERRKNPHVAVDGREEMKASTATLGMSMTHAWLRNFMAMDDAGICRGWLRRKVCAVLVGRRRNEEKRS
jgi:hypothetical protein